MKNPHKLKPLKPSMRENKRYLLVEGKNRDRNIEQAFLEFSGILGLKKASPGFIELDVGKNKAVVAVNREAIDLVRASLAIWPEKITVKRVSGSLKGLGVVKKSLGKI